MPTFGDSGVENVIPRTELDGFIHPREIARHALGMEQGPLAGNLIDDDHETHDSPAESAISASSSFIDPGLSNSSMPAKASSAANEEIMYEEEVIEEHLDVEESTLEKLARLCKS